MKTHLYRMTFLLLGLVLVLGSTAHASADVDVVFTSTDISDIESETKRGSPDTYFLIHLSDGAGTCQVHSETEPVDFSCRIEGNVGYLGFTSDDGGLIRSAMKYRDVGESQTLTLQDGSVVQCVVTEFCKFTCGTKY
ncbi:MAG: hypothetical protein AAB250_00220 [Bdellovibrionota bacterium]